MAELPPPVRPGMIAPFCGKEPMAARRSAFRIRAATAADGERVAAMCAALSAEEGMGATSRFTAAAAATIRAPIE